jgi:hypothetical protein
MIAEVQEFCVCGGILNGDWTGTAPETPQHLQDLGMGAQSLWVLSYGKA